MCDNQPLIEREPSSAFQLQVPKPYFQMCNINNEPDLHGSSVSEKSKQLLEV